LFSLAAGRRTHSWPLPGGIAPSVDLHYGVAVVTAGPRLYAVDVSTGRIALVARAPASVHAEIEAPGIVYQFNRDGKGILRLIPFSQVRAALG
jgi:hypothetical protein